MLKMPAMWGNEITATIKKAIDKAKEADEEVEFEFNGVIVRVLGDSSPSLIYRDWSRAMSGKIDKFVGPRCNTFLSAEEIAHDEKIDKQREEEDAERTRKYRREQELKTAALKSRLSEAGELEIIDRECWEKGLANNQDGYGRACYTYAETWGRLMQLEMSLGNKLESVADRTSSEADVEGITGFMYGAAVSILSHCWKYGEQLRRWHNLSTQLRDEGEKANESGGVLNPALLSVR